MDIIGNSVTALFLLILLRYLVIALIAFLIFYVIWKSQRRFRKIQLKFPEKKDYLRELGYSILTVTIFTAIGWLIFMTPIKNYTQVYWHVSDHSLGYFFFSVVLTLLVHDTYFYWTHRAMHHPLFFNVFHKVHHLSTNPSPWAAFAFHPLEAVVEASIIALVAFLFPVHPLAIALFLLIMMIYNVYGHLGFELYPRGFSKSAIGKWINTSVNHNQHHQFFRGNYGLYFLWTVGWGLYEKTTTGNSKR
jgi:sterol desaturase/sphingolipid hydroxylase (fatty acid hydroxylase superfamily)